MFTFILDKNGNRIPVKEYFCPTCKEHQMYYQMTYAFGCGTCGGQSFIDRERLKNLFKKKGEEY